MYFTKGRSCPAFRPPYVAVLSCRERRGDSRQFRRYLRGDARITAALIPLSGFSDRWPTEWKGNEVRPQMTLCDSVASVNTARRPRWFTLCSEHGVVPNMPLKRFFYLFSNLVYQRILFQHTWQEGCGFYSRWSLCAALINVWVFCHSLETLA